MSLDLRTLSPDDVAGLSNEQFRALGNKLLNKQQQIRKECQIRFYEPVSDRARDFHRSTASYVGIGGGNRASKTSSALAEAVALATGVLPQSIWSDLLPKFRGPISVRVIVESKTVTLAPTILPKLQWWTWNGIDRPGGQRGHWGFVPRHCLINGEWKDSWSEKNNILKVRCFDPHDPRKLMGESSFQFLSHNMDPTDFSSGEFHIVIIDEPTRFAIWRENVARVRSVNGRIILAMTWPDEPGMPVDWIYDEIYDRAQPGPNKNPDYDWFNLWTVENQHLDQDRVQRDYAAASAVERAVRFRGEPIRFSNRIHPLFTDTHSWWCFRCNDTIFPEHRHDQAVCASCESVDVVQYCHVADFETQPTWPVVYVLDPHPRKPHMMMWAAIDPADDVWVVAESDLEGDCTEVARTVESVESGLKLNVVARLIDPNMGRSPASQRRDVTWQDEFSDAELSCDLADDSDVGRGRVNEYLKPDEKTLRPRLVVHTRCHQTTFQMKRYTWDEHRFSGEKDLKQKPRTKYDDYPTMLKYLMNFDPRFDWLYHGAPVIRRPGKREGPY